MRNVKPSVDPHSGYVVISPVCNEADHVPAIVEGMLRQSQRPQHWFVIDDGSTDGTLEQFRERCQGINWIQVIAGASKRYIGLDRGEVWSAMGRTFPILRSGQHGYIAKLDGDIVPENRYFESLLACCERDPTLGMVSGACWEGEPGREFLRRTIPGSCWPCARLYRRACFDDIKAHHAALGWDMLHVLRARARGWNVEAFLSPRFRHLRRMGSRGGVLRGKVRAGRTSYLLGYSSLYFAIRLVYESVHPPRGSGSAAMLYGYLRSLLQGETRIVDPREQQEMRRMQGQALRGWLRRCDQRHRGYRTVEPGLRRR